MGLGRFVKIKVDAGKEFTKLFEYGVLETSKKEKQHRDTGLFHCSSIGYCLLNTAMTAAAGGKKEDSMFTRKVNLGSGVHELYQRYLAASGKLYGLYYCKGCKATVGPCYGGMCELCAHKKPLEYSELTLLNMKLRVSGHPDGFMCIDGKVKLIEIKTISGFYSIGKSIDNVEKSVPEHKRQANFYVGLLQEEATIIKGVDRDEFRAVFDTSEYILVYHDKATDDMIPYAFPYSPEGYAKDRARVQSYHAATAAGTLPPAEASRTGCRYCGHLNTCNGLNG